MKTTVFLAMTASFAGLVLAADGDPTCNQALTRCASDDASTIATNLINAGTQVIEVTEDLRVIGTSGSCQLLARSVGADTASSYAQDAGYGAKHIVDSCAENGEVDGSGYAGGNGNFLMVFYGN